MKRIFCMALAAVMLTGCSFKNRNEEQTSTVTTETTPLTLTESFTTAVPEPKQEEKQKIRLAVFNPFSDSIQVENSTYNDLCGAIGKISDGRAFLYGNMTGFAIDCSEYFNNYADTDTVLEKNEEEGYYYCPINTDFAATEEELFQKLRAAFTENFISDEELNEALFAPEIWDNQPSYKTIDGVLCFKEQYDGVMISIRCDDILLTECDGNTASAVVIGEGADYPPNLVSMKLEKSYEYGWRLDSIDYDNTYYKYETTLLYNAVTLRTEKLNKILGGGDVPENADTITVDGVEYTEASLDTDIEEMRRFFEDTFRDKGFDSLGNDDAELCGKYIRTYIDDVYYEKDGKLYRRNNAPKWYLPELQIDIYSSAEALYNEEEISFAMQQPFYDSVTGESFSRRIAVSYSNDFYDNHQECSFLYIASELPIRVLE